MSQDKDESSTGGHKRRSEEEFEEIADWLRGPAGVVIACLGVVAVIVGIALTFIPAG